jgi:hypothetical protein
MKSSYLLVVVIGSLRGDEGRRTSCPLETMGSSLGMSNRDIILNCEGLVGCSDLGILSLYIITKTPTQSAQNDGFRFPDSIRVL